MVRLNVLGEHGTQNGGHGSHLRLSTFQDSKNISQQNLIETSNTEILAPTVQWATKVMTPTSMYFLWKQGS